LIEQLCIVQWLADMENIASMMAICSQQKKHSLVGIG